MEFSRASGAGEIEGWVVADVDVGGFHMRSAEAVDHVEL